MLFVRTEFFFLWVSYWQHSPTQSGVDQIEPSTHNFVAEDALPAGGGNQANQPPNNKYS